MRFADITALPPCGGDVNEGDEGSNAGGSGSPIMYLLRAKLSERCCPEPICLDEVR